MAGTKIKAYRFGSGAEARLAVREWRHGDDEVVQEVAWNTLGMQTYCVVESGAVALDKLVRLFGSAEEFIVDEDGGIYGVVDKDGWRFEFWDCIVPSYTDVRDGGIRNLVNAVPEWDPSDPGRMVPETA